uniref:uncharacterized protein LOC131125311 n=1 Tax=Doryrhamphus excisus TaxID=161450 RepID=UPI0025AE7DAB|nr:uncharacterized protein LOC131125311 [Doryrhamphus excisus]XP_057922725.1 uncharacterized protein LOC131125311 [Doryrhamphus excisus]XP_057922726.1 uncharacterized protein LOC131125311 [Doryrhamphus excisus]XP_057922727.1 uncharacterized protein LOC131125311 [Doryrhamphus excisus]XP_057922728.1 uncharacterized protein LOC131125313 [Doryrhamphus excisus]XP_057922729.1 uncharacterized protein LOC131125313 [Doryrhamphus excisus]
MERQELLAAKRPSLSSFGRSENRSLLGATVMLVAGTGSLCLPTTSPTACCMSSGTRRTPFSGCCRAVMNENWMILSWVMVQFETDKTLRSMCEGLSNRYNRAGIEKAQFQWVDRDCCAPFRVAESSAEEHLNWDAWQTTDAIVTEATSGNLLNTCASRTSYNNSIVIKLDLFHCMQRLLRECASEHHPLYGTFAQFLSAAFSVVDQEDLQRLQDAYVFCGIQPANPTKQHIREHCGIKIPSPGTLIQRMDRSVSLELSASAGPETARRFSPARFRPCTDMLPECCFQTGLWRRKVPCSSSGS